MRLEGLGVSFLCSNLVDVRKQALDVLFTVRELHGKLLQAGARSTPVTPVTPLPPLSNPPTGDHSVLLLAYHVYLCFSHLHVFMLPASSCCSWSYQLIMLAFSSLLIKPQHVMSIHDGSMANLKSWILHKHVYASCCHCALHYTPETMPGQKNASSNLHDGTAFHSNTCFNDTGSSSPGWEPDLDHTYLMDVIEEIGFDVSHRCYWDFGRWSDLWRVWRRAGDDLQPQEMIDFEVRPWAPVYCLPVIMLHNDAIQGLSLQPAARCSQITVSSCASQDRQQSSALPVRESL